MSESDFTLLALRFLVGAFGGFLLGSSAAERDPLGVMVGAAIIAAAFWS